METNFSDYVNDAVRVLVLLNAVKDRKSIKATENKQMPLSLRRYAVFIKWRKKNFTLLLGKTPYKRRGEHKNDTNLQVWRSCPCHKLG